MYQIRNIGYNHILLYFSIEILIHQFGTIFVLFFYIRKKKSHIENKIYLVLPSAKY